MIRFSLKLFIRHFQKYRLFSLINVVGLGIGLATVIIIGSWIHFHLTFNHSLNNADRLFRIIQLLHHDQTDEWVAPTPTPLADALRQNFPEIYRTCRIHPAEDLILRAQGKSFSENKVIFADSTLFNLFSFAFLSGRNASVPAKNEMVISESIAGKYFDEENPLGKRMQVEEHDLVVAGVFRDLPANTHFDFQVVLPLELAIELHHEVAPDAWHPYDEIETYVEINSGVEPDELQTKISRFKARFIEDSEDKLILQPIKEIHTHTSLNHDIAKIMDPSIILVFATVALLLLIISVSNFFIFTIAQSTRRIREIAIRKINGSSARNILTGLILDSFLMVMLALAMGLILVELFMPLIQRFPGIGNNISFLNQPIVIISLVILILLISLGGGFINGVQLLKIQTRSLFTSLSQNKIHQNRVLRGLVILQFTISLSMLIFAFAIHSQMKFVGRKEVGFDKNQLISIKLFDESKMKLFENLEQFVNELKSYAGIQDVTFSCSSPAIINTSAGEMDWDGKKAGESLNVQWNSIFYNYFRTIGVELVAGRDFSENFQHELAGDDHAVYVVNEETVRGMGMSVDEAVGTNIELYGRRGPIIGVVRNFHFKSLHEKITPMAFDMLPFYYNEIIVRTTAGIPPPLVLIEKVYKKYLSLAPFQYDFISDQLDREYQDEKNLLSYHSILAMLMVVISALGLSSLAYLMIISRIKETGIRKINGATGRDIFRLYMICFGKWIFLAMLVASPLSFWMTSHWLENFVYRTSLTIQFFLYPSLLLIFIYFLSVVFQVYRASRANPVEALRYE